ncbi:MAG: response regulator [Proteobacteria bacterium]|nr:response regulator [Pseudomonadota bacterium]MBU1687830.1 response regulator [Pseudomonadota bacterium]
MNNESIIIVDDEPAVLSSLKRALIEAEYQVATFPNGEQALASLAENPTAVIVSDFMMPGMSGIEVLDRAREISPDTIRVLITGALDLDVALEAISRGEVYRIIRKPWNDLELKVTITQCLEQYHLIQENHHLQQQLIDQARIEMVKALVVTLNHEINNSLVFLSIAIDSLARSFGKQEIPADHEEFLKKMKTSCLSVSTLVKKLQNIEEIQVKEYLSGTGTMMIDTKASGFGAGP